VEIIDSEYPRETPSASYSQFSQKTATVFGREWCTSGDLAMNFNNQK